MIDSHVHIEFGEYTINYLKIMVDQAINKGITELRILDHTHKFVEFKQYYQTVLINDNNRTWYNKKNLISIIDYINFIKLAKKEDFPIKVLFGLEVCYLEDKEDELRTILNSYSFDFLIGSVHFIDGIAFDLNKENWLNQDVNHLYKRYYEIMENLIKSQIFTSLAHPDSIKLFEVYPEYNLESTYRKIAKLLNQYKLKTENNSGLIRYGFPYPGLNPLMYKIFKEENVKIERASDAHKIEDIGRAFDKLEEICF